MARAERPRRWTSALVIFSCFGLITAQQRGGMTLHTVRRPELSWKGPISADGRINSWDHSGHASRIPTAEDFVRLVPPIPLAFGGLFTAHPIPFDQWTVEVAFRVHGALQSTPKLEEGHAGRREPSKGGRGLAFWYAKHGNTSPLTIPSNPRVPKAPLPPLTPFDPDSTDGAISFFGYQVPFEGLGVIFDTAPSTPVTPRSRREYWGPLEGGAGADSVGVVSGIMDDGTGKNLIEMKKRTDMKAGEEAAYLGHAIGDCEAGFRNAPGLVWARVTHAKGNITVELDLSPHTSLSLSERHYSHKCFSVGGVQLPSGYRFGISGLASSNDEPDTIDVYAVEVREVVEGRGAEIEKKAVEDAARERLEERTSPKGKKLQGTSSTGGDNLAYQVVSVQAQILESIERLSKRVDRLSAGASTSSAGRIDELERKVDVLLARLLGAGSGDASLADVSRVVYSMQTSLERLSGLIQSLDNKLTATEGSLSRLIGTASRHAYDTLDKVKEIHDSNVLAAAATVTWVGSWRWIIYVLGGALLVGAGMKSWMKWKSKALVGDEGSPQTHGRGQSVSVAMGQLAGGFRNRGNGGGKKMI